MSGCGYAVEYCACVVSNLSTSSKLKQQVMTCTLNVIRVCLHEMLQADWSMRGPIFHLES